MNSDFKYTFIWRDINDYEYGGFADDLKTMKHIVDIHGYEAFMDASARLKNNKNFVLYAVKRDPYIWSYLFGEENNLAYDKEVIIATIYSDYFVSINDDIFINEFCSMIFNDEKLKKDIDIMLALADIYPRWLLDLTDNSIKSNKNSMLMLVSKCGYLLEIASDELKDDEDIVIAAVLNDIEAFQFASQRLRHDKKIVSLAINSIIYSMQYFDEEYINDALSIIINNTSPECINYIHEYFSNELKNDITLIKKKNI